MSAPKSLRQIGGVAPSTASTSDSTLIIIDAQNEYVKGNLTLVGISESRKVIADLLQKYRAAKGNIVHVLHDTPEGAPIFTPGTELALELDELAPKEGEKVIHKRHPGSFTGTDLQETLDATGSKKVVIVGYMAHVCVSTTARQASERGFDVLVVEDAVSSRDIPGVKASQLVSVVLSEIADGFGTVIKSSSIA